MSTTTTTTESKAVNVQAMFANLGPRYRTNRKLADAVIGILNTDGGNPEQAMVEVRKLIDDLKVLVAHGVGYTPPSALGFGSENASTIAQAVLGQRASTSSIRSNFAKIGA